MKKVEAIVRKSVLNKLQDELRKIGIEFFTYWEVKGVGMAKEEYWFRGTKYNPSSIERLMISIIVRKINLQKTIDCILKHAHTGEIGDGKIFVSTIEESYRIRTGEKGDVSLYIHDLDNSTK